MLELSNIISKKVFSKTDASIVGKIKSAYFSNNFTNIVYFALQTQGDDVYLPFESISHFCDAIVVENSDAILSSISAKDLVCDVLGLQLFTPTGILRGEITDIEFTKAGTVNKIISQSDQFTPSTIAKVGDVILLKQSKKSHQKTRIPKPKTDYPVYLLASQNSMQDFDIANSLQSSDNTSVAQTKELSYAPPSIALSNDYREPVFSKVALHALMGEEEPVYLDDSHTPTRIICNYDFLLGRKLTDDLYTYGGEIIATKEMLVTEQILNMARKAGKLVDLTLHSQKA